jgi:hypothetical protein
MRSLLHTLPWFIPFVVGQFGFDFGDPGLGDISIVDAVVGLIVSVASFLWNALVAVANYLFAVLQFIWNFLLTIFNDIKNAFKWLWDNVVKVGLTKIVSTFLKVRQWLSNLLAPVLKWIKQIRAWYDQYFNQFVKPMLKVLRQIRQVLQVFKLLGFKWAARLDADIARIENKIVSAYVTLRGYLNIATSWIQLIVDPLGILRRNPLFAAIIRSAPELRNLMDWATVHPQSQAEVDKSNRNNAWFQPGASANNFTYYQKGQLPPDLQSAKQEFLDAQAALPGLANQQLG